MPLPTYDHQSEMFTLKKLGSFSWLTEAVDNRDYSSMSDEEIEQKAHKWAQEIFEQTKADLEIEFIVWDEHNGWSENDIIQQIEDELPALVSYLFDFMMGYQVRPMSFLTLLEMIEDDYITPYEGVHIIHKGGSLDLCLAYTPEKDGLWYEVKEYFKQCGITCTYFQHQETMKNYLAKFEIEEIFYQEWGDTDWIPSPLPEAYR